MSRFAIKYVFDGIILVPFLLWFTEITVWGSLIATLGFTVIAYFIGDLLILRASNNIIATVADSFLAAPYLWLLSYYFKWSLSTGELLLTVASLAFAELGFHLFLRLQGEGHP